jgi:endonuclease III
VANVRDDRLRRRVKRELDSLEARFGRPRLGRRLTPLDELVLTILSQHTNDLNRDRAYASLRRRFPSWSSVVRAHPSDLEESIRVGGLARTKSRVIQEVLRTVRRDHRKLDLSILKRLPIGKAKSYLLGLQGVGEKTACCVLLFACGRPAFPVDTHIHRVARRLGWVPTRATPARTHTILAGLIPQKRYLTAHINLITLGRRICRSRSPDCPRCPLRPECRYALKSRNKPRFDGLRAAPTLY